MKHATSVSVLDLMGLLGKLNFASIAVPLGRLHSRPLQRCLPRGRGPHLSMNTRISLTSGAIDSLLWWSSPPTGWGARLGRLSAQGKWSRKERTRHINLLELIVVHLALQLWQGQMTQKMISVQMDNTTEVAYLIKEGGTQSPVLSDLASKILIVSGRHTIVLRPTYLPGLLNMEADALSRHKDSAEWMLTTSVARKLFLVLGYPVVDLFASARTKQVRQYFTTDRHDHRALGTDALHHKWEFRGSLLYAFPPPMLIPLVLARIHQYKTVMIIVTPWWPHAPWLPELIRLSVRLLYRLPDESIQDVTHNKKLSIKMLAWLISSDPARRGGSRLNWPHSSRVPGSLGHGNSTHLSEDSGCYGVADKTWTLLPLLP